MSRAGAFQQVLIHGVGLGDTSAQQFALFGPLGYQQIVGLKFFQIFIWQQGAVQNVLQRLVFVLHKLRQGFHLPEGLVVYHNVGGSAMGNYIHSNQYHYRLTHGGSIASPVAQITSGSYTQIPASERPPTCSASLTTHCLPTGVLAEWNELYASLLGQWDYTSFFNSRDAKGNVLNSVTNPPSYDQTSEHFEFTACDTWQAKPCASDGLGWVSAVPTGLLLVPLFSQDCVLITCQRRLPRLSRLVVTKTTRSSGEGSRA